MLVELACSTEKRVLLYLNAFAVLLHDVIDLQYQPFAEQGASLFMNWEMVPRHKIIITLNYESTKSNSYLKIPTVICSFPPNQTVT